MKKWLRYVASALIPLAVYLFAFAGTANAAFIFHSGFENGNTFEWASTTTSGGGVLTVQGTTKNTGSYALHCDCLTSGTAYVSFTGSYRISFYLYVDDYPANSDIKLTADGTFSNIRFGHPGFPSAHRHIGVTYNSGGLNKYGTIEIPSDTWVRVSYCHDGNNIKVYVNGVEDISLTSVTPGISQNIGITGSVADANVYIDDVAVDNTASTSDLGDIRVLLSQPSADGTNQDFKNDEAGITRPFYDSVDDNPGSVDITTYCWYDDSKDGANSEETFALKDCSTIGIGTSDTVNAVSTYCYIKRGTGSSSTHQMVEYDTANTETTVAAGTSFGWFNKYRATAPTSGTWSQAIFNAYEAGVGNPNDGSQDTYISCVMVMVAYTPAGGCSPDISNTPSSWSVNGGTPVRQNSSYASGLTNFSVTNNSGGAVSISIQGTDMTGGGYTWTLSDTATPGNMIYGLKAGLSGGDYTIIVKKNAPYNNLTASLGNGLSQDWGLKLYTPTVQTNENNAKTGTVTITATCL